MKASFDIAFNLITAAFAFAVGAAALLKYAHEHAAVLEHNSISTHALTEFFILLFIIGVKHYGDSLVEVKPEESAECELQSRRSVFRSIECVGNLALLIFLALEVFGIYIPNSGTADVVIGLLNCCFGMLVGYCVCGKVFV